MAGTLGACSQVFCHPHWVHALCVHIDRDMFVTYWSEPPQPPHSVAILAQVIHAEGGLSSAATADHLQVHSCSFTVCTASCLLNMLVIPWRVVQVVSCFSCAVLPFLVRTWSGLAHANGIKSPSISMPSPYSQCALWGARDVPEVSLPWSLPSCASSLPPSTTPSSQTSLGPVALADIVGLDMWAWHKSVLCSALSTVKFDDFVYWLVLLPAAPSLLDNITGPCLIDAAMLMLPLSEDWPVLLGAWPAPCFQPYVFAALNAALLLVVFQVVLLVFGRNILVSPWLLDLRLSPSASPTAFLRLFFWEGMFQRKEVVKESLFSGPSCLFSGSQAILSAVFLAGLPHGMLDVSGTHGGVFVLVPAFKLLLQQAAAFQGLHPVVVRSRVSSN